MKHKNRPTPTQKTRIYAFFQLKKTYKRIVMRPTFLNLQGYPREVTYKVRKILDANSIVFHQADLVKTEVNYRTRSIEFFYFT